MRKMKELSEGLETSDKEITRKWHHLRSQMCAEKEKK